MRIRWMGGAVLLMALAPCLFGEDDAYEYWAGPRTLEAVTEAICNPTDEYQLEKAISQARNRHWDQLAPCIRALYAEYNPPQDMWCNVTCALLELDKNMSPEEVADIVQSARELIHEPTSKEVTYINQKAFRIMRMALWTHHADVRADLLQLAKPGWLPNTLGYSIFEEMWSLFGEELTPSEIETLRNAWMHENPPDARTEMVFFLYDHGYPPSTAGLGKAFETRDPEVIPVLWKYVLETHQSALIEQVRAFQSTLNPGDVHYAEYSLNCTQYLFLFDYKMPDAEVQQCRDVFVSRLLNGTDSAHAYEVLLDACQWSDRDIKDVLFKVALPGEPLRDRKNEVIRELFWRYGKRVTEQEIAALKNAWKESPEMQTFITETSASSESANKRGQ